MVKIVLQHLQRSQASCQDITSDTGDAMPAAIAKDMERSGSLANLTACVKCFTNLPSW